MKTRVYDLKRRPLVSVAVLWCLIGSAMVGCEAKQTGYSGFLGDYSKLKASADVEGAEFYQSPTTSLSNYSKFLIDPVVVHFVPDTKAKSLDPAKLNKLTDFFSKELVEALSKRYQVVSSPGPGVLRLRIAITDIKKTSPVNLTPAAKLTGLGLGGASMEAEALDSQTRQRVSAVVDSRPGNRLSLAGLGEFDHAKEVFKHWIKRFVKRLDAAHGRK